MQPFAPEHARCEMVNDAGYSGTPLAKKLGLADHQNVAFVGLPETLAYLTKCRNFTGMESVHDLASVTGTDLDMIHVFTDQAQVVQTAVPLLRDRIRPNGMIWMSWPKKASKVPTDITEGVIRAAALADILVDVKVCAVDEIWSGLKLVIRKSERPDGSAKQTKGAEK